MSSDDRTDVLQILIDSGLPIDGLASVLDDGYVVARVCGRCVGLEGMDIHGDYGLLRCAAVAAPFRGQGIGSLLTVDRLMWARERKLVAVYLLTTSAGEYFARFDFRAIDRAKVPLRIARSHEYSRTEHGTATVMMRPVEGPRERGLLGARPSAGEGAGADAQGLRRPDV